MAAYVARLEGTWSYPRLRLTFPRFAPGPDRGGQSMVDWVKALPGRFFDPETKTWVVDGTGPDPYGVLEAAGFEIDTSQFGEGDFDLEELVTPAARVSSVDPSTTFVRPRLLGYEETEKILGPAAVWDKKRRRFEVRTTDIVNPRGEVLGDIIMAPESIRKAVARHRHTRVDPELEEQAARIASLTGAPDDVGDLDDIPGWFGLDLFGFQYSGAVAAAHGRRLLADPPGLGKGSPLWEKILTPTGWTTYGDIKVGDRVVGSHGCATRVTGVHRRGVLDVYRVTMGDGSCVVVDGDHLWQVDGPHGKQVKATRDLMAGPLGRHARIPMVWPVLFDPPDGEQPLRPYLVGVLLSMGRFDSTVEVTVPDRHVRMRVEADLPEGHRLVPVREGAVFAVEGPGPDGRVHNDVTRALGVLGLSRETGVPARYLLGSVEDRTALLRGLLDTQDCPGAAPEVVTASARLAEDVVFLVQTLGGQAQSRAQGGAWRVEVRLGRPFNPFHTPGKAAEWEAADFRPERHIVSIEPAGREEVVCISVDAPDQLYVTRDCIVTHNTRQALGAAAIDDPQRLLIISPPVALTQWQREAAASQVAAPGRYANTARIAATDMVEPGGHVVVIVPNRKQPPLPDEGVVVVSDALIASRKPLADELIEWAPQVLIVDEVHRQKTWESARSKAVRRIAETVDGPRYAISGTPMFAHPHELASPLAITGQLDPVMGGLNSFVRRFCYKNRFGMLVARKKNLPVLHDRLKSQVWVRRRKKDVLKDLPDKSRHAKIVDVDLTAFRDAHAEVLETISDWVDDHMGSDGSFPGPAEVEAFAKDSIHLISRLREGAGLSKVEVAADLIAEWLEGNPADEDGTWDRPLVVWTHHKVVTAAMREAAVRFGGAEVIDGSTSQEEKTRIVDAFQAGRVPVLIASITAAGVGITLTRSSDVLFVETDWTPALVAQAEDRCLRIGQTRPVSITTLVAPGTLDETIQRTLERKARDLRVVMGDEEGDVAVAASGASPAARIVQDMVEKVIGSKRRRARRAGRVKRAA